MMQISPPEVRAHQIIGPWLDLLICPYRELRVVATQDGEHPHHQQIQIAALISEAKIKYTLQDNLKVQDQCNQSESGSPSPHPSKYK